MDKKIIEQWSEKLYQISFELEIVESALRDFKCTALAGVLREINGDLDDVMEEMDYQAKEVE